MEVTHPSTSRQTLLAHQRARSVNTIHCSAISLPGTVTKTVDQLPLSRCFCCFCVNTHGHVRTEQIDRNAKIHSFIHSFIADICIAPLQVGLLRSAPNPSA